MFIRWSLRFLGASIALVSGPRVCHAQVADHYRGTVVNDITGQPASLELFVYARTDTSTIGWMRVGNPLDGSGTTAIVPRDLDSLYFVTVATSGDTLIWASPQRAGTLEGRYWIKGANYNGQGGRWRLVPQPPMSKTSLVLFSICLGALCVLLIATFSAAHHARWWKWRTARGARLTPVQRLQLSTISGWLAWAMLGNGFMVVYLLLTVREALNPLGGMWVLGLTVDSLRPVLFFEAAGHFFQLFGIALGLLLIVQRSRLTPLYWVLLLVGTAIYAIVDMSMGSIIGPPMARMFGQSAADVRGAMQEAVDQNARLIGNAAVWSLYWIRSKRVAVLFGQPAPPSENPLVSRTVEPNGVAQLSSAAQPNPMSL